MNVKINYHLKHLFLKILFHMVLYHTFKLLSTNIGNFHSIFI